MDNNVIAEIAKEISNSEDMRYVREALRISRERQKTKQGIAATPFAQDTKVTVYNLGEHTPGEFKALVKGVYGDHSYILEMCDRFPGQSQYSHVVMAFGCVKEGWIV